MSAGHVPAGAGVRVHVDDRFNAVNDLGDLDDDVRTRVEPKAAAPEGERPPAETAAEVAATGRDRLADELAAVEAPRKNQPRRNPRSERELVESGGKAGAWR